MSQSESYGVCDERTHLRHETIRLTIASRVLNTREELLAGHLATEIRELLVARGVLVFPEIHFSDEEQITFTKTLSSLDMFQSSLNAKETARAAEYLNSSSYSHLDCTTTDVPILASLLSSKKLPTWGGTAGFCTTYAAWNHAPTERQSRVDRLRAMHSAWASLFYDDPAPSLIKLSEMRRLDEQELPLIWQHHSRRRSLVRGSAADHAIGLSAIESSQILVSLREWATEREFSYNHEWRVGDLVMWDNTGAMQAHAL